MRSFFLFPLLLATFGSLPLQGQDGLVPNGDFEDSTQVFEDWDFRYGEPFFEDSIQLKGPHSLGLESANGHIDIVLDSLRPNGRGLYELSFWYRAFEGHDEAAPFWVELIQGGSSVQVFRPGSKEARTRKLRRDWILFSVDVRLSGSGPAKLFIHSDLPVLWLDDVNLHRKA
jgi:hypothetical protein